MSFTRIIRSIAFLLIALVYVPLHAEPWLSNRFAQNCSACHSPARRNVEPINRRCTLSCQGCHTNPSGGGLRNEYGGWNQQRWLRSFKSEFLQSKGTPAPLKYQKYAKSNDWNTLAKNPPPLVVLPGADFIDKNYDRSNRQEYSIVQSRGEFFARLTEDDPYRLERSRSVFAGGDFRYFYMDYSADTPANMASPHSDYSGLIAMAFDVGVKVRPIREHFSLVFENRYFQTPNPAKTQSSPESVFLANSEVRTAYALIDNLAWNTYVQYGLYRPMFGHYNPDHTTLLNTILFANNDAVAGNPNFARANANSAHAVFKSLSVGGSPNVPFINAHMIMPTDNEFSRNPFSQDKGFALNLGGRFVTLGTSLMFSYWSTSGQRFGVVSPDLKNNMMGFTGGFNFQDFTINVDYTKVDREFYDGVALNVGKDAGVVSTLEAKYRIPGFRETYLQANYATANVARSLKAGSATETMYGFKTFLLSGTEFEFLAVNRDDVLSGYGTTKSVGMQAQLHLFF